jgi:hypothetical protein
MTFGRRKITGGDSELELLRFCNKIHTKTMGGASKLFSYFIKNFYYDKIKSYSDIRYSEGELYERLGFSFKHQSQPNYWYFKTNSYELFHRSGFQKHLLQKKLKNFDPNLTEHQNMLNNDYQRIFDCGSRVYYYESKKLD